MVLVPSLLLWTCVEKLLLSCGWPEAGSTFFLGLYRLSLTAARVPVAEELQSPAGW